MKKATRKDKKFTFFGGKGGVGKTTCSTAAAIREAAAGRRVLIVSTDPAHSLGDALDAKLSATPKKLPARRGALYAVELDADQALSRWLTQRQGTLEAIAERGTYLDADDIHRLLRLALPGVDELVGLLELRRLANAGDYDTVIVDTAPTGHTLRLLAMPETLRTIATVFDDMQAKHRFLSQSLGRRRYRADAEDELIEEIDREGKDLAEMLRDPKRVEFHWVLLPETLALEETKDAIDSLDASGIQVGEIIVNRVRAARGKPCATCHRRIEAETAAVKAIRASFSGIPIKLVPEDAARESVKSRHSRKKIAARAGSADWLPTVAPTGSRLLLFAGKGGVGKSTCAATTALVLAEKHPKKKMLVLSTDPAHSLGDVLQLKLGGDARSVEGYPALHAREMDAQALYAERRDRYRASIEKLFDAIQGTAHVDATYDRAVMQDLIDLSPPGIDEIFGILSVSGALIARKGQPAKYDLVVVDTAPTGHALRLLEMPQKALDWVHALLAILLKYREVGGLGGLATDLLELARQMRELQALLRDSRRTRLVAVTRAARLPRLETERLLQKVRKLKIAVSAVLVNAVTEPACATCRPIAALEQEEMKRIGKQYSRILAPSVAPPPRGTEQLREWSESWKVWNVSKVTK